MQCIRQVSNINSDQDQLDDWWHKLTNFQLLQNFEHNHPHPLLSEIIIINNNYYLTLSLPKGLPLMSKIVWH